MTYTTKPLAAALRLEIESDPLPGQLVNLVPNPNGELGGWGWLSPTTGAVVSGGYGNDTGFYLRFLPGTTGPQWFTTEALRVTAGQYVAAFYKVLGTGTFSRVRFEWLDTDGNVLSSSAQSPYFDLGDHAVGPFLIPAGTVYARLRFDVFRDTAGNPPVVGQSLFVNQVTVATAATSSALGTIRTNLVPNPSFETNTTGWSVTGKTRITRVTTEHQDGAAAAQLLAEDIQTPNGITTSATMPVSPTQYYAFSAYVKRAADSERAFVYLIVDWYNGATLVRRDEMTPHVSLTGTDWLRLSRVYSAPVDCDAVAVSVMFSTPGKGDLYYVDAVMIELGQDINPFIVGSVSTPSLSYVPPIPYVNILGTTHDIDITREGLNVGTLTAHIVDSALDPTQSSMLRPGRPIRCVARDGAGEWRPIFTGTTTHAVVDYALRRTDESKRADIELAAVDNGQRLANQRRDEGVGTVAELPYVLEGCGVPWNVNGSGAQVSTATVASVSDNASALDQVMVTRDSRLGQAWIDRRGVLYVVDRAHRSTAPVGTLGPDTYIDVGVSYDSDVLMNELNLSYLYDDGSSDTFGPYRNESSIDKWGIASADFTIHGIGDDDATLTGFATQVLNANGTPAVRLNSMQLHVDVSADWTSIPSWFAWIELYDIVTVTYARERVGPRVPDEPVRVVRISHSISAPESKWQIELGFMGADRISLPTTTSGASVGGLGGGGGSGGGGGTVYSAGPGLSLTGNDFAVNVDGVGIEINADALRLKDGGVTSAKIADGTIGLGDLSATGTRDATKYLRGDNTWAALPAANTKSAKVALPAVTAYTWTTVTHSLAVATLTQVMFQDATTKEAVALDWKEADANSIQVWSAVNVTASTINALCIGA